jgi:hypothetical protein
MIKGMTKFKLQNQKEDILTLLSNGSSINEIARQLNVYPQSVSNLLKSIYFNIKFSPNIGNIHYFENINSYAKAYIVGFIAADGSLVKTKTTVSLTITLKYEDRAVLEFIKSEIGNSHKLQEIKRASSFDKNKEIHHIRYVISNKTICNDLTKYGITSNKSLTMGNIIKNIPFEYRDAFIIGYFDGDGSVTIREGKYPNDRGILYEDHSLYIQIRGTKKFLKGICNHLGISESHIKSYDSIPQLVFTGKKDTVRFFKCYNNLIFYYKRKYDKFLKRINHPSYDKYKQDQTISSSTD